jgi:Mg2+/citrate symporter
MWVSVAPMVLPLSGPAALDVVTAIGWAGAVAGGLSIVPWGGTRRRTIGMIGFVIGSGFGMVLMGVQASLAVIAIGFAVRLASMAGRRSTTIWTSCRPRRTSGWTASTPGRSPRVPADRPRAGRVAP